MKKIKFTVLFISLVMLALSLTSCFSMLPSAEPETQYQVSEHELQKMLEEFYKPGDNLDININTDNSTSLVAASKAVLSVVSVTAYFDTSLSAGAGVIYKLDKETGDAYIITNYHVVNNVKIKNSVPSENIKIYLFGQEYEDYAIPATYVGGSANYDLAVLKVKGNNVLRGSCAAAVSFADSNNITLLDTAIAIGNPGFHGLSATVGYISVDSEYIDIAVTDYFVARDLRVMRTDAAVTHGNSGGGLFNDKGELIGIVNAISKEDEDVGYAIPSNVAKYIAENIIYYCDGTSKMSVYRCLMGVTVSSASSYAVYDEETGRVMKVEDVEVAEISDTGIAAGKLQVGDIIKKMTIRGVDYKITRVYSVVDSMLNARVGDTVEVHIERGGVPMCITIQIPASALTETP